MARDFRKKIKKELHFFEGFVTHISETQNIEKEGRPALRRATMGFSTLDEQLMFLELRSPILERVEDIGLSQSDKVRVGVVFAGNKRGESTFNNIFCNSIDYVG